MPLETSDVIQVSKPLYQSRNWLRLIGILLIINGAVITITGIGVLIAWLPIWLGVLLLKTAQAIRVAHQCGSQAMLELSLQRLRFTFTVMGVSVLLLLAGTIALAAYYYQGALF